MEIYQTENALSETLNGIKEPTIRYQEWKRKKMADGKERMRIVDLEMTKEEFIQVMKETHNEFKIHVHNVIEQYKGVKLMKEKLPEGHIIFLCRWISVKITVARAWKRYRVPIGMLQQ